MAKVDPVTSADGPNRTMPPGDAPVTGRAADATSVPRRLWNRSLWQHALLLAALLAVLAVFTRPDRSFSSDEGAAVIQAKRLAAGSGWLRPNDFIGVDPTGVAFFYSLSDGGPEQFTTYGKHPTYPLVLAALDRVGGTYAMELLSIGGLVAAALMGALIARRLDPRIDRATFWALGIGSPLLFYSQVVLAHSIGAALAGAATLAILRFRESSRVVPAVVAAGFVGVATLFRTEALLFALSAGLVLGIMGLRGRRWSLVALAAALPVAALVANLFDRVWFGRILGRPPVSFANTSATPNFVETRLSGAADLLLLPGATWPTYIWYGLLLMLLAIIGTSLLVRSDAEPGGAFRVGCVLAIVGAVLPFTASDPDTIPSILITFPILAAGLALLHRRDLERTDADLLLAVTIVFVVAVAATQYTQGGGAEWGARFLTMILPLIAPVALLAIARTARRMPRPARRLGLVTLVVVTAAMSVLSIRTLVYYKGNIDTWVRLVDQAQAGRRGPDLGNGDRRPIVVTSWGGLGRFVWPVTPEPRGLTVPQDKLRAYAEALRGAGAEELIFATYEPQTELPAFDGLYEVAEHLPATSPRPPVYILRAV